MMDKYLLGEWSDKLQAFWFGANNCEHIAFKGSNQVFVYDCDTYPLPPIEIIQHTGRIETLEDFDKALNEGKWFTVQVHEKIEKLPDDIAVIKQIRQTL